MMGDAGSHAAALFAGFVAGFLICLFVFGTRLVDASIATGRRVQFCVDHSGAWDERNNRCLKTADTLTVQVAK